MTSHTRSTALFACALVCLGCAEGAGTTEDQPDAASCTPVCASARCGDSDGCGGKCAGACPAGEECHPVEHVCRASCTQTETAAQLCERLQKDCGSLTADDLCGNPQQINCGSCEAPFACTSANQCVIPGCTRTDTEFCASRNVQCGRATGEDECGISHDVPECGPCTSGACNNGICTVITGGEQCASAPILAAGIEARGVTTSAADDYAGACARVGGRDLTFRFLVPTGANKDATIAVDADFDAVVYLRRAPCESSADIECTDNSTTGLETLIARNLSSGEYFAVVDGYAANDAGAFSLTLTLADSIPPPANDTCATAKDLGALTGPITETGNNANAQDDYQGACADVGSWMDGGDTVYKLHVVQDSSLAFRLGATNEDFEPALYVTDGGCDPASNPQVACARFEYSSSTSAEVTGKVNLLTPGDYWVFVDGSAGSGAFALELIPGAPVYPPPNDTCDTPETLTIDATGFASALGTTSDANADDAASCSGEGPDVVYAFTIPAGSAKNAVIRAAPDSSFDLEVHLRSADCAAGTVVACVDASRAGFAESVLAKELAPGTYFVWVKGYSSTDAGSFTLELALTDPPANDGCGGTPQVLQFDSTTGIAAVSADTRFAHHDAEGTCDFAPAGDDLVYTFTTTVERSLAVRLAPAAGSRMSPVAYLRKDVCDARSAEVACGASTPGASGTTELNVPRLSPGTYFLWVDSFAALGDGGLFDFPGPFELQATLSDPVAAPPNDSTCAAAEPLPAFDAQGLTTVLGETTSASNDSSGSCSLMPGPDLVYSFTLAQPSAVVLTVTPDPSTPDYRPAVYLRDDCSPSVLQEWTSAVGVDDGYGTFVATAKAGNVPAGTHYVFVDGLGGYPFGVFRLDVLAGAPVAGPGNDACRGAQALTMASNPLAVSGTTAGAGDDAYSPACSFHGTWDVVYSLDLDRPQDLAVSVAAAAGSELAPVVYVRRECGQPGYVNELACSYGPNGTSAVAEVLNAEPGRYYIWVEADLDSHDVPTTGAFEMNVALTPPTAAPANDHCDQATEILVGAPLSGQTTRAAVNDFPGALFPAACETRMLFDALPAGDVVYAFTPQSNGDFTFTLTPESGLAVAAMWVGSGTCGAEAACLGFADTSGADGEAVLRLPLTAGQTYYVIVDSYMGNIAGAFTIGVL